MTPAILERVSDSFEERPDDTMVSLAQRGRALGTAFVMSIKRKEERVMRTIRSHDAFLDAPAGPVCEQ